MSDNEDLELQALQRKLDDAFATTRPRAGFEDDLWSRMQARQPLWSRVRDVFGRLVASVRSAPAVPAAAVAVLLVLAIGIGILSRLGPPGGGASTASSRGGSAANYAGASAPPGAFGPLPAPQLQPGIPVADPAAAAGQPDKLSSVYAGPANFVWAGELHVSFSTAPVFRYQEPTALDADRFATSLGASPTRSAPGFLGSYSGDSFVLSVVGTNGAEVAEPLYYIIPNRSRLSPAGPSPAETAMSFLSAHGLVPAWPYVVAVEQIADFVRVTYIRGFNVPGYGTAYQVNAFGLRHGLVVDVKGGQVLQAFGPLPVNLDSADYPIISTAEAVRSAVALSSTGSADAVPTVRLTNADLVYAVANARGHSFYVPAFLFSGTFIRNGITYTKRVLVPAVAR